MITMKEVLQIPELRGVRLLAGEKGLDREVQKVTANDSPDGAEWAKGGEVVLSSGYIWRDNPEGLLKFIQTLDSHKSSGFGVKLKRYLSTLPEAVERYANETGFPILSLPEHFTFDDFIHPALTFIVNEQAAILRRSHEIHRTLTESISCQDSLDRVADILSRLLDRKVALLSHCASPSCVSSGAEDFGSYLEQVPIDQACRDFAFFPITISGRTFFTLFVDEPLSAPSSGLIQEALYHAGAICRYIIQREQSNQQVEMRYRNEFFRDILSGAATEKGDLERRAKLFGMDLSRGGYVMIIQTKFDTSVDFSPGSLALLRSRKDRVIKSLLSVIKGICPSPLVDSGFDRTLAMLPCEADGKDRFLRLLKDGVEAFLTALPKGEGPLVSCGVGGFTASFMEPAESYRQAVKGLEILRGQPPANRIATWEDAGFLRLVGEVFDSAECRSFSDSTLGALANQKRYSHLLETLIALEASQWNLKAAARSLFVHYNTLKYRYRQIEQILGKSLDCQENRLNLSIALRLKNLSKA